MQKIWTPLPLHIAIIELLQKRGVYVDVELLKELKKFYGDLSFRELNDALMRLELRGIIRVSRLTKDKRNIELV
ncbi:MAG: ArsR family transcriptional regulator [Candidatus Bathyarchaeia archaeon]